MPGLIVLLAFILIAGLAGLFMLLNKQEIHLTDNALDLAAVLPIQFINDNYIVNGNGDITVGFKLFLPEVFTLSDADAIHIHERMEGLFKMLPGGTVIHQQTYYYADQYENEEYSDNFLQQANLNHFNGKEILKSYSNLYLTFTNNKVGKKTSGTSLTKKQNYPFTQPFKEFEKQKDELSSVLMNFENGISSISGISVIRMTSADLNNAICDFLNVSYNTPTDDATQMAVNPLSVTRQGDFKVGNQLLSIISLIEEGARVYDNVVPNTGKAKAFDTKIQLPEAIQSKCSMIYPIGLGLPFNHVLNVIIEVTDSDATVTAIRAEKSGLNFLANWYQPAKEKQKEQEAFCDAVMQNGYQTSYTAVNILINDTDKINLNRKIALAQQGFTYMQQAGCYVENEEIANLFFTNIPGNARANYRGFVNTTKQAICYLQKENMYLSSANGYIFSDRFGRPVKIDLWNYPQLVNRNKIMIGPSGSGKSFWINNFVLQSIVMKKDVVIIDIGGSYRSLINLNHGKYFDSTEKAKFAFNPFLCPKDLNGNYNFADTSDDESTDDLIKTISTIISFIWKGNNPITPTEKAMLEKSIKAYYAHINANRLFPSLTGYAEFLAVYELDDYAKSKFDTREILLLLEPYTVGDLAFLLNAKENVDIINDSLIAFDMEDATKKDYFPIVSIITLQMIVDKIKKRQGVAKTLIIDEALDFLKDEKFGDFIAYLYRTFRKKEGEIILAAQNVLFIEAAAPLIRDSIIINCATKILLDHNEHRSNLPKVQNILSITEEETKMIESIQNAETWRDFFIKIGNDSFIFRNEVSPVAAVAFDSRQKTVVALRNLFNETGSMYAAINKYIEQQKLN